MAPCRQYRHDDYTVGWICAVECELRAAKLILDQIHPSLEIPTTDKNTYEYGEISGHNVVIACLPSGIYGNNAAAAVAHHMNSTFKSIEHRFMVGIAGGVPSQSNDIRLGDVVVSKPVGKNSGVIQYDFVKSLQSGDMEQIGCLNKPPEMLLTAIQKLQTEPDHKTRLVDIIAAAMQKSNLSIAFPGQETDRLFQPSYMHPNSNKTCDECDKTELVSRIRRNSNDPLIHYGLIASGNQVMKDAIKRDAVARSKNILCFEMEAAALMDSFPCLVIRGICDYADSHKNKDWQPYAAVTAAAYAKVLLQVVPRRGDTLRSSMATGPAQLYQQVYNSDVDRETKEALRSLFIKHSFEDRQRLMARKGGPSKNTCHWILEAPEIMTWLHSTQTAPVAIQSIFWLHGLPGSGKSTMAMFLTEALEKQFHEIDKAIFAYFFCEANSEENNTVTAILRGLIYQFVQQDPRLRRYLVERFNERREALFETFESLWTLFTDVVLDEQSGVKYCVIDALDECDAESQKRFLTQLQLSFSDRSSPQFPANVRILITSRPYDEINIYLKRFPNRDLASFPEAQMDIEIFIDNKLDDVASQKNYWESMKKEVKEILLQKAEGTFLWVGLTCDELINVPLADTIPFLKSLAPGLNKLYSRLMLKAMENNEKRDKIYRILSFVAVSRRPLTALELCIACRFHEEFDDEQRALLMKDDIKLCRLMVIEKNDIVTLLHKSVHDFLFRSKSTLEEAHAQLAYSSIDHLADKFKSSLGEFEALLQRSLGFGNVPVHHLKYEEYEKLRHSAQQELYQHSAFLPYCCQHWMEHAQLAYSNFCFDSITHMDFLAPESSSREKWLLYYRSKTNRSVPSNFSILHIAAKWGIPKLISHRLGEKSMSNGMYVDTDFLDSGHQTPLEVAVESGHESVIIELLDRLSSRQVITNSVIKSAVSNSLNGDRLVQILLKHCRDQIPVTEKIEIIAARNEGVGATVLDLLLPLRKVKGSSSERLFIAACENQRNGKDIVTCLFKYLNQKITVTERMLVAAAGNSRCGTMILTMFLEHWQKCPIPQKVAATAAGNRGEGVKLMRILLKNPLYQFHPTDDLLQNTIHNIESGRGVIDEIIPLFPECITVDEMTLGSVFSMRYINEQVIYRLLDQPSQCIYFTNQAIHYMFERMSTGIISRVLNRWPTSQGLTEDIIVSVAANKEHGVSITKLLIDRYEGNIPVTTAAVVEATKNGPDILKLLLEHGPQNQNIVYQDAIISATVPKLHTAEMLLLLLRANEQRVHIDEKLIRNIVGDTENSFVIINKKSLAEGKDNLKILLRQERVTAKITVGLVNSCLSLDKDILHSLLSLPASAVEIEPSAVMTILEQCDKETVKLLIDRENLFVPLHGLKHIAVRFDLEIMLLLLARHDTQLHITSSILLAANENSAAKDVLEALIEHTRGKIDLDARALDVILDHCEQDIIELCLKNQPPQILTRRMVFFITNGPYKNLWTHPPIRNILESQSGYIRLKQDVMKAIVEYCDSSTVESLLNRTNVDKRILLGAAFKNQENWNEVARLLVGDAIEQLLITDKASCGIAQVADSKFIKRILMHNYHLLAGKQAFRMQWLLEFAAYNKRYGDTVTEMIIEFWKRGKVHEGDDVAQGSKQGPQKPLLIPRAIISAAAANDETGRRIIEILCSHHKNAVLITMNGLEAIVREVDHQFLGKLIDSGTIEIPTSDATIEAAAENSRDGRKVMEMLVSRHQMPLVLSGMIVRHAALNRTNGWNIMEFLIRNKNVIFELDALSEFARLFSHNQFRLLLETRRDSIRMEESVILGAIEEKKDNPDWLKEILHLLFDSSRLPIVITPRIIQELVTYNNGYRVLSQLFKHHKDRITIPTPAMKTMIKHLCDDYKHKHLEEQLQREIQPMMTDFLQQPNKNIAIYDEVLVAAVFAGIEPTKLTSIQITITEENVTSLCAKDSLGSTYASWKYLFHLLLRHEVRPLSVNAAAAIEIAKKCRDDVKIRLLSLSKVRVEFTQRFALALAKYSSEKVMVLLFDRFCERVDVNEGLILAAVSNKLDGEDVLNLLFRLSTPEITHRVIVAAVRNSEHGSKILDCIFQHREGSIVLSEDILTAAAGNRKGVEIFDLQRYTKLRDLNKHVTQAVLMAAAQNYSSGSGILQRLLTGEACALLTEDVVVTMNKSEKVKSQLLRTEAATELGMVQLLVAKGHEEIPSQYFLMTAFSHFSLESLSFLINRHGESIQFSEDLMIAVARREDELRLFGLLLTQTVMPDLHDNSMKVTYDEDFKDDDNLLRKLLPHPRERVKITASVIQAAIGGCHRPSRIIHWLSTPKPKLFDCGPQVLKVLLKCRDQRIEISLAAVQLLIKEATEEIAELLLFNWHSPVLPTSSIFTRVARRFRSKILSRLLEQNGSLAPLVEKLLIAATQNKKHCHAIVKVILANVKGESVLTEKVFLKLLSNCPKVEEHLEAILSAHSGQIYLTEKMVTVAALQDDRLIQSLLEQKDHPLIVTADTITSIINYFKLDIVEILFERMEDLSNITDKNPSFIVETKDVGDIRSNGHMWFSSTKFIERMMVAAIENQNPDNFNIFESLFALCSLPIVITERMMVAAASAKYNSSRILDFLINCNSGNVPITESVLIAALRNPDVDKDMLQVLLSYLQWRNSLPENMLIAALQRNQKYSSYEDRSQRVLRMLLAQYNGHITSEMMAVAARHSGGGVRLLHMLLEKERAPVTEEVLLGAVQNENMTEDLICFLVKKMDPKLSISEGVVKALFANNCEGEWRYRYWQGDLTIPRLLLDRLGHTKPISPELITMLAKCFPASKFRDLVSRCNIGNPEEFVIVIAQDCRPDNLRYVLDLYGHQIRYDERLLLSAARNTKDEFYALEHILDSASEHGKELEITTAVLNAVVSNTNHGTNYMTNYVINYVTNYVDEILSRAKSRDLVTTESIIIAASQSSLEIFRELWKHGNGPPKVTLELMTAAAGNTTCGTDILRDLLDILDSDGDDVPISETAMIAAAANPIQHPGWMDWDYIWYGPVGLLLRRRGGKIKITEKILIAAAGNPLGGHVLKLLFTHGVNKSDITENVIVAATGNSETGHEILPMLFNNAETGLNVNEKMITAAAGNKRFGKKILKMLLEHHGQPLIPTEETMIAAAENDECNEKVIEFLLRQYEGPIAISNNTLDRISQKLDSSMSQRLRERQIIEKSPEPTTTSALLALLILFLLLFTVMIYSLSTGIQR